MVSSLRNILKSLQYDVNSKISETIYKNKFFQKSKWSIFEYNIIKWSQDHTNYIFKLCILAVLVTINLILWKSHLSSISKEYFTNWKELTEWQDGFLAGQLTIVGVVYPLVIGLVSVLFQNKSAKNTIIPIYQVYSGFMFAGLSGLCLSIYIIIGYFASSLVTPSTYLAFCITTAVWLLFNISLTFWFFIATFLMLDESKRDRLVVRYTIHELCELDIRSRIFELLQLNAVKNKVLINPNQEFLTIDTYNFIDSKYKEIKITSGESIKITNIYYAPINLVIAYYYRKLVFVKWLNTKSSLKKLGLFNTMYNHNSPVEFIVQPLYSKHNPNEIVIFRYSGLDLSRLSKFIIKVCFRTKSSDFSSKSLNSMIHGITGAANDALREKDSVGFKNSIENLIKWHVEIASSLDFTNDEAECDNWLLLPTANFFSRTYLEEMMTEYYQISKSSIDLIPESSDFFEEAKYLYKAIYSSRSKPTNKEGLSFIQGSYYIWASLMEWKSYNSTSSDMRIANKYEDILYNFVGSWESWSNHIVPGAGPKDSIIKSLQLMLIHLQYTAQTAITSLRYNNLEATGWGVDMLNNWRQTFQLEDNYRGLEDYQWHSGIITHNILTLDPNGDLWTLILNGSEFKETSAIRLAINNAHIDLRIITACYMLIRPKGNESVQISKFITALLNGTAIHSTGSIRHSDLSISCASDILEAYIRHRDYPNYDSNSYSNWIESVLESFNRVNDKKRISGRVYTGWGRNNIQQMSLGYIEIALSHSNTEWTLDRRLFDLIFSGVLRHQDQKVLVDELRNWIKMAPEIVESSMIPKSDLPENLKNFTNSINNIITQIVERQRNIVVKAKIDEERLLNFGKTCSKRVLSDLKTLQFPFNLFGLFYFNEDLKENDMKSININNYLKENISEGIDTNRAINEEEWLQDIFINNVGLNILRKIIDTKITESLEHTDIEQQITDIVNLSKNIEHPIMLCGNEALSRALREAAYNPQIAEKYDISFIDGNGINYICNLGNISVFSLNFTDINYSFLTSKELFNSLLFRSFSENQVVDATYTPYEDQHNGQLSLRYGLEISLNNKTPFIRLNFNENTNSNS